MWHYYFFLGLFFFCRKQWKTRRKTGGGGQHVWCLPLLGLPVQLFAQAHFLPKRKQRRNRMSAGRRGTSSFLLDQEWTVCDLSTLEREEDMTGKSEMFISPLTELSNRRFSPSSPFIGKRCDDHINHSLFWKLSLRPRLMSNSCLFLSFLFLHISFIFSVLIMIISTCCLREVMSEQYAHVKIYIYIYISKGTLAFYELMKLCSICSTFTELLCKSMCYVHTHTHKQTHTHTHAHTHTHTPLWWQPCSFY